MFVLLLQAFEHAEPKLLLFFPFIELNAAFLSRAVLMGSIEEGSAKRSPLF